MRSIPVGSAGCNCRTDVRLLRRKSGDRYWPGYRVAHEEAVVIGGMVERLVSGVRLGNGRKTLLAFPAPINDHLTQRFRVRTGRQCDPSFDLDSCSRRALQTS